MTAHRHPDAIPDDSDFWNRDETDESPEAYDRSMRDLSATQASIPNDDPSKILSNIFDDRKGGSVSNSGFNTGNVGTPSPQERGRQPLGMGEVGNPLEDILERESHRNTIIMWVLIAMIVILVINFFFLVYKPLVGFLERRCRKRRDNNETLIERRYKTIDKWLIQKTVQPHDATCKHIQNYTRFPNGESSLGRFRTTVDQHGALRTTCQTATESYPAISLAASFETNSTHAMCSSSSSSSSSEGDAADTDDFSSKDDKEPEGIEEGTNDENSTFNFPVETFLSEPTDDQCEDSSKGVPNVSTDKSRNETIFNDTSPVELHVEQDNHQQPDEIQKPTPIQSHKVTSVEVQRVFLTREQVLDRMEIIHPNTKQTPESSPQSSSKGDIGIDSSTGGIDDASLPSEEDDDWGIPYQECSICMEAFKVGDKVSFSPSAGCHHVFHHDCLKHWLLRKTGCPYCRVVMLPIDRPKPKDFDEQQQQQQQAHQASSDASAFRSFWRRNLLTRNDPSPIGKKPWNHKNPEILRERRSKKCGTYCCVSCGVIVLKTDLREDLCTRVPTTPRAATNEIQACTQATKVINV